MPVEALESLKQSLDKYLRLSLFHKRSRSSKRFAEMLKKIVDAACEDGANVAVDNVSKILILISNFDVKKRYALNQSRLRDILAPHIEMLIKYIELNNLEIEFYMTGTLGINVFMPIGRRSEIEISIRFVQNSGRRLLIISDSGIQVNRMLFWQEQVTYDKTQFDRNHTTSLMDFMEFKVVLSNPRSISEAMIVYGNFINLMNCIQLNSSRFESKTVYQNLRVYLKLKFQTIMIELISYLYRNFKEKSTRDRTRYYQHLLDIFNKLFTSKTHPMPFIEDEKDEIKDCLEKLRAEFNELQFSLAGNDDKSLLNSTAKYGFFLVHFLGCGGSSNVCSALTHEDENEDYNWGFVAAKFPREDECSVKGLLHELKILDEIGAHSNITNAVLYTDGSNLHPFRFLIMEIAVHGNLRNFCSNNSQENEDYSIIMLGIIRAIRFLEGHRVSHQDLHPGNVLIHEGAHPKVTDFGSAILFDNLDDTDILSVLYGFSAYTPPDIAQQILMQPIEDIVRNNFNALTNFMNIKQDNPWGVGTILFFMLSRGWQHGDQFIRENPAIEASSTELDLAGLRSICVDPCPSLEKCEPLTSIEKKSVADLSTGENKFDLRFFDKLRRDMCHPSREGRISLDQAGERLERYMQVYNF